MNEFLHIIVFNAAKFLIIFLFLKFHDKRSGENTAGGLRITYALSIGASLYFGNSLMKQQMELPITAGNVLTLALMLMIPFSVIINFGYVISVILRAVKKKRKNR